MLGHCSSRKSLITATRTGLLRWAAGVARGLTRLCEAIAVSSNASECFHGLRAVRQDRFQMGDMTLQGKLPAELPSSLAEVVVVVRITQRSYYRIPQTLDCRGIARSEFAALAWNQPVRDAANSETGRWQAVASRLNPDHPKRFRPQAR